MEHTVRRTVRDATTLLFVPGDRPERFGKAAAAGADVVIIDLEDAVAPQNGATAAANVVAALGIEGGMRALVRVHGTESSEHRSQVDALLELVAKPGHGLLGVMVAKAEDAAAIADLRRRIPRELALVALVESARGLRAAESIATIEGVTRLAFGAIDFSLDVGADLDAVILDHARSQLVVAARAGAGSAPLESPSTEIADTARVRATAARARSNGFGGMLAIHPAQLAPIAEGFAPTEAQVVWAREVLAAEGGAAQVRGQLVDRPVTERARAILLRRQATDATPIGP